MAAGQVVFARRITQPNLHPNRKVAAILRSVEVACALRRLCGLHFIDQFSLTSKSPAKLWSSSQSLRSSSGGFIHARGLSSICDRGGLAMNETATDGCESRWSNSDIQGQLGEDVVVPTKAVSPLGSGRPAFAL